MNSHLSWLVLVWCGLLFGCASMKNSTGNLAQLFGDKGLFSNHFVGFILIDPASQEIIYEKNAHKYFTPASNTKILTLAAALNHLEDSLAFASYAVANDTLYLWGLGDPTTLHPLFEYSDQTLKDIAQIACNQIVVCQNHFEDHRFGAGWAWDDYNYGYQVEKSALPVYGNRVWLHLDSATQSINYSPTSNHLMLASGEEFLVQRAELENDFLINTTEYLPSWRSTMPLHINEQIVTEALSPLFNKPTKLSKSCPTISFENIIYSTTIDTAYRRLMHQSDNFIAEQLLLQISALKLGVMNTSKIISFLKSNNFNNSPDPLLWTDGSGLSRYNLFTPRSIAFVLQEIYKKISSERRQNLFAAGGQSGTIKRFYAHDPPFVYAKTGTLRNKHALSGYLTADSGKVLIFSFMHNNFPGSSATTKPGMDQILRYIKSQY